MERVKARTAFRVSYDMRCLELELRRDCVRYPHVASLVLHVQNRMLAASHCDGVALLPAMLSRCKAHH